MIWGTGLFWSSLSHQLNSALLHRSHPGQAHWRLSDSFHKKGCYENTVSIWSSRGFLTRTELGYLFTFIAIQPILLLPLCLGSWKQKSNLEDGGGEKREIRTTMGFCYGTPQVWMGTKLERETSYSYAFESCTLREWSHTHSASTASF